MEVLTTETSLELAVGEVCAGQGNMYCVRNRRGGSWLVMVSRETTIIERLFGNPSEIEVVEISPVRGYRMDHGREVLDGFKVRLLDHGYHAWAAWLTQTLEQKLGVSGCYAP